MLEDVYKLLSDDDEISSLVDNQIKYYEYPRLDSMSGVYVVIDPLDVPQADTFGDDDILADSYLYQIEVWSKDRKKRDKTSRRIAELMRNNSYMQGSGTDEWDKETGIFRDARRYEGTVYRDKLKG